MPSSHSHPKKRIPEFDALRGIAILGMFVFHFAYDLNFLGYVELNMYEGFWLILARVAQFLFLGLVGVSIHLSSRSWGQQCWRALKLFAVALCVSAVTWFVFKEGFIRFGVLHFIAFAIPLVALFKGRLWLSSSVFLFGLVLWQQGVLIGQIAFLGGFLSSPLDYFAPFPWILLPLGGLLVGEILYAKKQRTLLSKLGQVPGLLWLGQHSLVLYLVHQPVFYSLLWVLKTLV